MSARRGIFLAPFDECVDPNVLCDLAIRAEELGWDGFFLWDHVNYRPPVKALADPWVAMAAMARSTERIRIGPMVTPLSRRRVHKLARETASLDLLSRGRLTFGVGLGADTTGELEPFGEELDPRRRAQLLDDGLEALAEFWGGGFEPAPAQQPRIPIWVAGRWATRRRPLERALRWDGFFPIDVPDPASVAELAGEVAENREADQGPFDIAIELPAGADPSEWEAAGATWILTEFGQQPRLREVQRAIEAGPAAIDGR